MVWSCFAFAGGAFEDALCGHDSAAGAAENEDAFHGKRLEGFGQWRFGEAVGCEEMEHTGEYIGKARHDQAIFIGK